MVTVLSFLWTLLQTSLCPIFRTVLVNTLFMCFSLSPSKPFHCLSSLFFFFHTRLIFFSLSRSFFVVQPGRKVGLYEIFIESISSVGPVVAQTRLHTTGNTAVRVSMWRSITAQMGLAWAMQPWLADWNIIGYTSAKHLVLTFPPLVLWNAFKCASVWEESDFLLGCCSRVVVVQRRQFVVFRRWQRALATCNSEIFQTFPN